MAKNNPNCRLHSVTLINSCRNPYNKLNEKTPDAHAMNWYLRDRCDILIPRTKISFLSLPLSAADVAAGVLLDDDDGDGGEYNSGCCCCCCCCCC